jgi:environmental stress-induced protein Ves
MAVVLRATERVKEPWKNGGGTTSVLASFPPEADPDAWEWRVSIAEVATAGPFSHFGGVDRLLALLCGELELIVASEDEPRYLAPGAITRFPGDLQVLGAPIGGVATDLNIMVRRGVWQASIERFDQTDDQRLLLAGETSLFLFEDGGRVNGSALEPHDAMLLADMQGQEVQFGTLGTMYLVSFRRADGDASALWA